MDRIEETLMARIAWKVYWFDSSSRRDASLCLTVMLKWGRLTNGIDWWRRENHFVINFGFIFSNIQ